MPFVKLRSGQKHFFRDPKKKIRPMGKNEVVEVTESNYKAFGDKFELVPKEVVEAQKSKSAPEPKPEPEPELALGVSEDYADVNETEEEGEPKLVMRLREDSEDEYDIIHPVTGEPLNEEPLSKDEAEALLAEQD